MTVFLFLSLLWFQGLLAGLSWALQDHECIPRRCSEDYGPEIRFPFWLKDHQPDHCGYPGAGGGGGGGFGFELSCSPNNDTLLELPFSVKVLIKDINYIDQLIIIDDPDGCFPRQLPNFNLSASLFRFQSSFYPVSLFSCPSTKPDSVAYEVTCLNSPAHRVFAVSSEESIFRFLISCRKMYNILFPYEAYDETFDLLLSWSKPICGMCEAKGKYCRLRNYSSKAKELHDQTECFDRIPKPGETKSLVVTGVILGLFLLVVVVITTYYVHRSKQLKKEDQEKVERFLEDYKALKPTRYTYAEVKKITNKFKEKLGQGGYGTVYKGKLSSDVFVAAKILNNSTGEGNDFINEVATIGRIHHVNVVRLVGYCADGLSRALVYEYLPNDSLENFISSDDHQETCSLGWEKMQDIALGIAKGIEYLHQGCDQRILHFDIKPHNVLLDHNFNPKISDFGLAKLCSKEQSAVSMTAARGTVGYIAPEVFSRNFGNVSYKSDVYSFGMLLLEMVGRRKNTDVTIQNTSEVYFPEWIYKHLNRGEEQEAIEIELDRDANKIVKKLTIVGLWCIQWYPGDRPSMKVVIQMLEGDVDTLAMPPNPFATTNAMTARRTTGGRPFNSPLEVISESE